MSIYTYESARRFCEVLGIEFHESPAVSDQELEKIPEGSKDTSFFSHWNTSDEGRKFVSDMVSGDRNPTKRKDVAEKISKSLTGKKKTQEHKNNLKGPRPSISGENHPMYGKDRSNQNNPMFGKVWINNGLCNKVICKNDTLPEGFVFGVKRKDKLNGC